MLLYAQKKRKRYLLLKITEVFVVYDSLVSTKLTRFITWIFSVLLLLLMIFADLILKWFFGSGRQNTIVVILITFYSCCPAAWCALFSIHRLCTNIIHEEVFILKNVSYMRILSWCCAFVALVCLVAGFFYVPFFVFSLGAAFMMLILRVLKNVMAAATKIKIENELTI